MINVWSERWKVELTSKWTEAGKLVVKLSKKFRLIKHLSDELVDFIARNILEWFQCFLSELLRRI